MTTVCGTCHRLHSGVCFLCPVCNNRHKPRPCSVLVDHVQETHRTALGDVIIQGPRNAVTSVIAKIPSSTSGEVKGGKWAMIQDVDTNTIEIGGVKYRKVTDEALAARKIRNEKRKTKTKKHRDEFKAWRKSEKEKKNGTMVVNSINQLNLGSGN